LHGGIDLRLAGHIHRRGDPDSALPIEFLSYLSGTLNVNIDDGNLGAGPGERASDLLADAACRAGDDRDLAGSASSRPSPCPSARQARCPRSKRGLALFPARFGCALESNPCATPSSPGQDFMFSQPCSSFSQRVI